MKKLLPVFFALVAVYYFFPQDDRYSPVSDTSHEAPVNRSPASESALVAGEQTEGSGVVERILPDDNEGSRHQRFVLRLSSGRTLLVAHNIDLAPRVDGLREGDVVEYFGEFESNPQGGVIHWTHHDPQRRHVDGWLRHKGRTYQ